MPENQLQQDAWPWWLMQCGTLFHTTPVVGQFVQCLMIIIIDICNTKAGRDHMKLITLHAKLQRSVL